MNNTGKELQELKGGETCGRDHREAGIPTKPQVDKTTGRSPSKATNYLKIGNVRPKMDTHRTDIKQQRDGGRKKGQWTKTDGAYQKTRLKEMASTPVTVAVRPEHLTHMQDEEKRTACNGQLLQYKGHCLKNSGEDSDQPAATAKRAGDRST